jgi:regulator of protease activity HflC (stomatin/prohibitin superfamily)
MGVGSVIYYQVIDPVKAKYEIQDVGYAIDQLTRTNLRNLMGGLTLDESLTSRDHVNVRLREVLDEASEKWGVKVTRVEIREIDPPKSIQDSMALQMQAERERRAQVTTAEGQKQAAILKAEGEKASKLLAAEGDRDAQIARAEGDRQSEILRANGSAQAMTTQFKAINEAGVSPQILALKYIEALQTMSSGQNKVFIPYEASALLGALGSISEAVGTGGAKAVIPKLEQSVISAATAARSKVPPPERG